MNIFQHIGYLTPMGVWQFIAPAIGGLRSMDHYSLSKGYESGDVGNVACDFLEWCCAPTGQNQ